MKKIKKAIIPAAGLGSRFLPATISCPKEMLTIVDKPVIQYIVEEAASAGIEEILIITRPDKETIERHFCPSSELIRKLKEKKKQEALATLEKVSTLADIKFTFQMEQKGLADAIYCGKSFIQNEPFAVLLGDTVINGTDTRELVELWQETGKSNVLVEYLENEDDVTKLGIIKPKSKLPQKSKNNQQYFEVSDLVEKPPVELAPSRYGIASRYIFSPEIFQLIERTSPGAGGELQITDSMIHLAKSDKLLACVMNGKQYNITTALDNLKANIDFAFKNSELKEILLPYIKNFLKNE